MTEEQAIPYFARQLKQLREKAGLSQTALANRAGLSKQALSHLEIGKREPTWATVQVLAAALAVDCREFLDPGLTLPEEPSPPAPRGRPRKQADGPDADAATEVGTPKKGSRKKTREG